MGLSATDRTCHCRGADSRARRGTADRYRLTLKQYAPIASVAALIERLAGWQHVPHGFYGVKPPDLSLRGGQRPTWQSREGSYVFAGAFLLSNCVLRDCHVASLLAMTRQGGAAMHQRPDAVELPCTRRSVSAATDAIGAHHFNDSLYELHCLPEIATSAYGLLAMTSRGLSPF